MPYKTFKDKLEQWYACSDKLEQWYACSEALKWLGDRTEPECLNDCHRGDWLLWWFATEVGNEGYPSIQELTKAKVECAKLVEHLMEEKRSIKALKVAEDFAEGKATKKELDAAASAAAFAFADADAAAAYAADAGKTLKDSVSNAYAAAAYAADAAYADDYARSTTLEKCAEICRKYLYVPKLQK